MLVLTDVHGKYSPESRKMSIIQRSCGGRQYSKENIPNNNYILEVYNVPMQQPGLTQ